MFPNNLSSSMNVRVLGTGSQVVALAHGFGCTQSLWDSTLPSLLTFNGGSLKLILWDWPGSSSTQCDDNNNNNNHNTINGTRPTTCGHNGGDEDIDVFHGFAEILVRLLDELVVSSCIFVGHSMSAMIGCLAALSHPHRFSKLVLICASPRYLRDGDYYGGFEREELEHLFEAMASDYKGWSAGFARAVAGDTARPEAVEKFRNTLSAMRPATAIGMARAIFGSDFRASVSALVAKQDSPPLRLLQTVKDLAVPMAVTDYLRREVGDKGSVEVLHIDGHLPQITSPYVFTKALLSHLG